MIFQAYHKIGNKFWFITSTGLVLLIWILHTGFFNRGWMFWRFQSRRCNLMHPSWSNINEARPKGGQEARVDKWWPSRVSWNSWAVYPKVDRLIQSVWLGQLENLLPLVHLCLRSLLLFQTISAGISMLVNDCTKMKVVEICWLWYLFLVLLLHGPPYKKWAQVFSCITADR